MYRRSLKNKPISSAWGGGGRTRTEQEDLAFDPPLSGHILTKAGPS